MRPLVSVIIPNYNHAKYLEERLDSILKQTYSNIEIIILDDCSTDNSVTVIDRYRNNKFVSHIIINEKNSGLTFSQWNKGFSLAKGDLIWIAESDDKCDIHMLEKLVFEFEKHQDCVLAFSRSIRFDDSGNTYNIRNWTCEKEHYNGNDFICKYMLMGNAVVNASSALFAKRALANIKDDYKSFKGAGDRLFWIYIAEKGSVSIINKQMNYFRQHGKNSTSRWYLLGNNQKEDRVIYNYICKGFRISIYKKIYSYILYTRRYIYNNQFMDDEIKKDIKKVWGINKHLDFFLIGFNYILNLILRKR